MFAIETKNLTKIYKTGHFWNKKIQKALDNLSLQIPKSQVFGILGLNGAGKTTLMKILFGIIRQTSGTALVLEMPAGDVPTHNKIAYLPEMPYFSKYLTPVEILNFYAQLFGIPKKNIRQKCEDALETVGLSSRKNSRLKEFSKGMLQRVGIAQILINDAELLFLDEPTYGLDPLASKEMRDVILQLKEQGRTIILSSHQISEVEKICDNIGILHKGGLIAYSPIIHPLEDFFIKKIKENE